jgi:hypothetical protein
MHIILSLISLPLGILIGLKYFNIFNTNSIIPFDIVLIGALYLIFMQIYNFISVHSSSGGTSLMGKLIVMILAIPGLLYLINVFSPFNLGFDLEIIIAIFLFTEGIYGLH